MAGGWVGGWHYTLDEAAKQETSVQHYFNEPTKELILTANPNPFFF